VQALLHRLLLGLIGADHDHAVLLAILRIRWRRVAAAAGEERDKLLLGEADRADVELRGLQSEQFGLQQFVISAGVLSELVVGEHVGAPLLLAAAAGHDDRNSSMPRLRAARMRPCPAMMLSFSSTSTGIVQPNSSIDFAIWSTWSSLCVRALRT
jgi:hypothetical protein